MIAADAASISSQVAAWATAGTCLIAAFGTRISLKLYDNEKKRRQDDNERYAADVKAAEEKQARLVSARVEPSNDSSAHVVANDSDFDITNCVTIYRTYRSIGDRRWTTGPPYPVGHEEFGLIRAHDERRFHALDADAFWQAVSRSVFVKFTDAEGRHWLRDREMKLYRLGPNGEIPHGKILEFDQWIDDMPDDPGQLASIPPPEQT